MFAVPALCEYLTEETKQDVKLRTKADEQGSKIEDFFAQSEELYEEMISQQQLKGEWVPPTQKDYEAEWLGVRSRQKDVCVTLACTPDRWKLFVE